jgi:hypothetical protein
MILAESAQRIADFRNLRPGPTISAEGVWRKEAWDSIDADLVEWLNDPQGLVEPGGIPPSRMVIRRARDLVKKLPEQTNWSAPAMVVPDNAGGLTFEFHSGGIFRMVSVAGDGRLTTSVFRGGQFLSSSPLALS